MMDESKVHALARRAGGRFHLASLVQKRLLELNRGQKKLLDEDFADPLYLVLREIEEGLIELAPPEDEKVMEAPAEGPRLQTGLDSEG
ncbi:MAG TPA: DNA-directed RNA polymerase subunit omega [Planctomycetota bacterium]|nr:DNA-directed RNA polymerase subunit omega [Planctomycetota bacterium]